MEPTNEISVVDVPEARRYELRADGETAGFLAYRDVEGVRVLAHAEVEPALEGRGLGSQLVAGALEDVRARGLKVVPRCPFVAAYMRRHPDESDLLAA